MGLSFRHRGNFRKTENFLKKAERSDFLPVLERYGEEGVAALASATPRDSGLTASSWRYEIHQDDSGISIVWCNDNDQNGWFNVAIGLQFGHGTRNGGYVEGIDYVNPAVQPIFDQIAEEIWSVVKSW